MKDPGEELPPTGVVPLFFSKALPQSERAGEMYRKLSYISKTKKDFAPGDTKHWSQIQ
jgi:hypothetical protein